MYDKLTDHTYALLLCQQGMVENIEETFVNGVPIGTYAGLKAELLKNIDGVRQLLDEFETTVKGL